MSSSSSSPPSQSQLTSFCIKLLQRINGKFDNKINQMEQELVREYEQKIAELQAIKEQIDKYHKIKSCIAELNAFYKFTHKGTKLITTVLPPTQPATISPYITTKHNICLQVLQQQQQQDNVSVSVSVLNGDCVQNEPNQPPKLVQPACFINGSTDALFGPSAPKNARVCIRKQHSVSAAPTAPTASSDMMVIETQTTDIILEFKNHEVRPEQINIRYACFPNENKGMFSYIDTVLGSHDGATWVVLEQADMLAMRNFVKSNVFKFPIVLSSSASSTPTFYKYICLRSGASKDLTHKNNLHKMFNKTHIPISNIEIYGHYSAPSNTNVLARQDKQLHNFVKSFLQFKHTDQTRNVELDYILNMFLESYKELNSLITSTKINQALADNRPTAAAAQEAAVETETETDVDVAAEAQEADADAEAQEADAEAQDADAEAQEADVDVDVEAQEEPAPATASLPAIQEEQEESKEKKPIKVLDLFDMTTKIVATPSKRKNKKSAAAAF